MEPLPPMGPTRWPPVEYLLWRIVNLCYLYVVLNIFNTSYRIRTRKCLLWIYMLMAYLTSTYSDLSDLWLYRKKELSAISTSWNALLTIGTTSKHWSPSWEARGWLQPSLKLYCGVDNNIIVFSRIQAESFMLGWKVYNSIHMIWLLWISNCVRNMGVNSHRKARSTH